MMRFDENIDQPVSANLDERIDLLKKIVEAEHGLFDALSSSDEIIEDPQLAIRSILVDIPESYGSVEFSLDLRFRAHMADDGEDDEEDNDDEEDEGDDDEEDDDDEEL
ncbi:unnamed protein product [Clonostachys rhizophaga]|uniref:Uncharacterized protein n=1 Tax=Clonostachys rhizophaga TaxID=160324 RepID=A0A9N9VNT2_9HYPO|nr:unnamed protein product [Clonostachys rhizophaga]